MNVLKVKFFFNLIHFYLKHTYLKISLIIIIWSISSCASLRHSGIKCSKNGVEFNEWMLCLEGCIRILLNFKVNAVQLMKCLLEELYAIWKVNTEWSFFCTMVDYKMNQNKRSLKKNVLKLHSFNSYIIFDKSFGWTRWNIDLPKRSIFKLWGTLSKIIKEANY